MGSKKWEVGGQKSNHTALSLNGKKSEIWSSNFVKSEVWSLKYEVLRLKQETIKGTERASPIYTLFHR